MNAVAASDTRPNEIDVGLTQACQTCDAREAD